MIRGSFPAAKNLSGHSPKRRFFGSLTPLMNKLTDIMEFIEDNWILYEILMQYISVLHAQIDLLIKDKKILE